MATVEQTYLRSELVKRLERLQSALSSPGADASLTQLLSEVDSALHQMDNGTYGLCEELRPVRGVSRNYRGRPAAGGSPGALLPGPFDKRTAARA